MSQSILEKYADLLCTYCVELKEGDKVYIQSSTLGEPLVREVYRKALQLGAIPEFNLSIREQERIFSMEAKTEAQLQHLPTLQRTAMAEFDAYILIKAPFNLREQTNMAPERAAIRQKAIAPMQKNYFDRAGERSLKRTFCMYPTIGQAQEAGMSLEEYEHFVFNACCLFDPDPMGSWLQLKADQQHIVDLLNSKTEIQYQSPLMDIRFNTQGRTWINSHGTTNMPSGEVYTSPVEDSAEGFVHFNYPLLFEGHEMEGITLWVEKGEIVNWDAHRGKEVLDKIFSIEGSRRFGEAAVGTNTRINRFTKNILFDEKIGGSIHMAIGQSYPQAGGKNTSAIHLDMISDMTRGGVIRAEGSVIYENGRFVF